jgi:hypothetical protein
VSGTASLKRCPDTNLTRHSLLRLPGAESWRLAGPHPFPGAIIISAMLPLDPKSTTELISMALGGLRQIKELAKASSDSDLREQISSIYDDVLELKLRLLALEDENRELKGQLTETAKVRREGRYFYKEGESDPLCPKCYHTAKKLVYLERYEERYEGLTPVSVQLFCRVCNEQFFERQS